MTTKTSAKSANSQPALILPGVSYPLKTFCQILGIDRHKLIEMRRKGLKARKDVRRLVIRGEDYHEYTATLPVAEVAPKKKPVNE